MPSHFLESISLPDFALWSKFKKNERNLIAFDLEVTARCNNNCRHCCINLAGNDRQAQDRELSLEQINRITDQAVDLGALWCLITGGEPLLRKDFFDIFLSLKRKGLLVSVFTNATLITEEHVEFFQKYPPRSIEITVYGVTKETYERVTGKKGSFKNFRRGLELLLNNQVPVTLKAMALKSNVGELNRIAKFCRQRTKDFFRFDPFLHLRFDGNQKRNIEIKSERLSREEIVRIEQADPERSVALKSSCNRLINPEFAHYQCNHLFHCGAGNGSFSVSYDGYFRLCSSLWHPGCIYDLKKGTLKEAWEEFVPRVRDMRSNDREFLDKCRRCAIINLCLWCPAHAYLETGKIDQLVDYFCDVALARKKCLEKI